MTGVCWPSSSASTVLMPSNYMVCSAIFLKIHLEMEWVDLSDSYCSLKPLWSGMGDVVPARTSPTLHPPCPPTAVIIPFKSVPVHELL